MAVTYIQSDLEFILQQILYAEAHAAGEDLNNLLPNVFVPWGLRTVDGSFNNLVPGQEDFGASGETFPTLLDDLSFREEYDPLNPFVVDPEPRTISNLIVDQTISNPAAVQAFIEGGFGVLDGGVLHYLNEDGTIGDIVPAGVTLTVPNTAPDEGLSAGFNTWFIFFGQFFDHGLDFIQRTSEIVMIPLAPDDPILVENPDAPPFMLIERTLKDEDGNATNLTTPFVDQNQTYASHPAHQVFLREYVLVDRPDDDVDGPVPVATGRLIQGSDGGMATWEDVKNQARDVLGIELTDYDVGRVPMVHTDPYGNFIPGENGLPQLITGTLASPILVEGSLITPVLASTAIASGHAFIIDIAHSAAPFGDLDHDPTTAPTPLLADEDDIAGGDSPPPPGFYDNELLNAHLMAGDGRANENIALSAVHHVFHSEHNRLVDHTKEVILASGDLSFLTSWLIEGTAPVAFPDSAEEIAALQWNGERLFQAARFGTEMQYQHLVFEEFARKVQPNVDAFLMYDATIDPAIVAEFAHVVYRFGHSMLTETVDRFDPAFNVVGDEQITLIEAFLNPLEFRASDPGNDADADAGAIVRGTTRVLGNEIDEFVTEALRNNLLGLPLDLATINLARGRETGVPTLNAARAEFYRGTGDSQLEAYSSWADFGANLKHFESLVNFIAAYGTHTSITDADTLIEKRAAAYAIVYGENGLDGLPGTADDPAVGTVPSDRLEFLNSTGAWASNLAGPDAPVKDLDGVSTTGLGNVDLWIGGLAERQMPFGGLLGSTFNFVFETQLEALQNGDRFYYLARTAGLNFLNELENNSFAKLIMANSNAKHLPADVFSTPAFILEVDQSLQYNEGTGVFLPGPNGVLGDDPSTPDVDEGLDDVEDTNADPVGGTELRPLVIRDNPLTEGLDNNYLEYTGVDHVVLGGTDGNDIMIASIGDDTLWGDGGNDRLEGGDGVDNIEGGTGDDIITDLGGDDVLKGNEGNDVIHGGNGFNLLIGGSGQDFIITGEDVSETFAGTGNDFVYGAKTNLPTLGNEGDDWIEIGTQDGAPGDNFDELARDTVNGNDIFVGGGGFDEMLGEGGDDIFVGSEGEDHFDGDSGFDWVTFKNDTLGVTADMVVSDIIEPPVTPSNAGILDRYAFVEGLSGSALSDHLRGDDADAVDIAAGGAQGSVLTQPGIDLIDGLQELLGLGVTTFGSGNIILGGSGSDIIEGRGGDDLIDGDRWLNVRISIRSPDGLVEWASADSMVGEVTRSNPAAPESIAGPLHLLMLNGTVNPGQLQAVREIQEGTDAFDTAVFSGLRADYSIVFDDNGTTDLSDDIVIVTDNVGTDGTDRLINIERLQFADDVVLVDPINGPLLNAGPEGLAFIDGVATQGQTLTVRTTSIPNGPDVLDGVSDADNPGGVITKPFQVVWQAEVVAGTGVFEDIVLEGGDKPATASSTSFVIPDGLEGLAIRAKIIYQDADGTLEIAFSAPTDSVQDAPVPAIPPLPVESATESFGVHFIRSDLQFILDQIKIAELHAGGEDLTDILANSRLPFGLRTVDGSFNNLVSGQENFGAADQPFPTLTGDPVFRNEADEDPFFNISNTDYGADDSVVDSDPRIISNLIVDQTITNPAAVQAFVDGGFGILVGDVLHFLNEDGSTGDPVPAGVTLTIPNTAPDEGLSAGFNAWMTFFGQFFDHGLDFIQRSTEMVVIPLQEDDPLFIPGSPTNFMVIERTIKDENGAALNRTTPFVDQNQTYTSHPSHQVFLRDYAMVDRTNDGIDNPVPVATGSLIQGSDGGMATWADVKTQALEKLGIVLTDADVGRVPLVLVDPYGNFIPGADGRPQLISAVGPPPAIVPRDGAGLVEAADALASGHAFIIDIAHNAVPVFLPDDGDPTTPRVLAPDAGAEAGNDVAVGPQGQNLEYDNELLDAHLMAGDGRANENIALSAVHHVFHSEHNRLVDHIKEVLIASNDVAFLNEWLIDDLLPADMPAPGDVAAKDALLLQLNTDNAWDGERLFQAARFGTEMQYQHLVFEEFARKIQPQVDIFFAPTQVYDTAINPAIVAEFAHTVYRFGHSMLTETVDRFNPDFSQSAQIGLIDAFLNPLEFSANAGLTADEAAGAIVRGTTRQLGNEIDEFVTEALRNNLLGLPLDLASINLARGREAGVPSLNQARREFYEMTGDSQLKPYVSWVDFMNNLKHPESVINFIAAYGTHDDIVNATTVEQKRAAAFAIVTGSAGAPDDRLDFLHSTGAWASNANGVTTTGLDLVDLWIGGLAERKMPFGGFLGSTFNFVFETQMEMLQDGDRFYYLDRTNGLNFLTELENNSFAKLIMANTDAKHLPGDVFSTPAFILEVDPNQQLTGLDPNGRGDPDGVIRDNPATIAVDTNYLEYTGEDHVVLGGRDGFADILIASIGDDTIYGDSGNDRIEGGDGNDILIGGTGDDIITDQGGDDLIQGLDGHDVIQAGNGINLVLGGFGSDFIITGEDSSEAFGGVGNDFILGVRANEAVFGNEGDDWLQFGMADGGAGDNFDSFAADPVPGNDIFYGDSLSDRMDGEGGDDVMMGNGGQGDRYEGMSGFDWASFQHLGAGVAVDMRIRAFDETPLPLGSPGINTRYEAVEGLSGSAFGDVLQGDDADAATIQAAGVLGHGGAVGSVLTNFALIDGLQEFVDGMFGAPQTFFDAGNIILGGDGSDIIIGGGGDDLIDGDLRLAVRISVRETFDLDENGIADVDAEGNLILGDEIASFDEIVALMPHMLNGEWNPGQLQVVRELVTDTNLAPPTDPGDPPVNGIDFDTAQFSGILAEYTFLINGAQVVGTPAQVIAALEASVTGDVITVTDTVLERDGVDRLINVERLQFSDQSIVLAGLNNEPEGEPTIDDDTPAEDQLLTVSIAGVTDADNPGPDGIFGDDVSTPLVNEGADDGQITGPVSYFWQVEENPGSGEFHDILIEDSEQSGGETIRGTGLTFTPGDAEAGLRLRVRVVYQDHNGVLEQVFSAPTAAVSSVNDAPVGTLGISDTSPTESVAITAINAFTDPDLIDPTVVFNYLWEQSDGVGGWVTAVDGGINPNDAVFTPTQSAVGQQLRVTVSYTDLQGNLNTLTSAPTTVVGNLITTNVGSQIIDGASTPNNATAGDDLISTGAGVDIINALGGNDTIDGGTGNDLIDAGAGDDLINYTIGGGVDVVDGGVGIDRLAILGLDANDTLTVTYNGTTLTGVGGGTLISVEQFSADLGAGTNSLTYNGATTAPVTVNLTTGVASGFISIANVQNVTGGAGNDSLTGGEGSNLLAGAGGNDTFFAVSGDGNDVYNGGAGTDTYDLSATNAGAVVTNASANSAEIGTDALTSIENIIGSGGDDEITLNGGVNVLEGRGGADTMSGGLGNDTLLGGGGNDLLNGQGNNDTLSGEEGDDTLVGGANNDTMLGGFGADTFLYTIGDGVDAMDGGADDDMLSITGTEGGTTLSVTWDGSSIISFTGGTVTGIEHITADMLVGTDGLTYATATSSVAVNLQTGSASGFSTISGPEGAIAGIENVIGGSANDTLTGDGNANTLNGGAGNDVLTGGGSSDILTGGANDDRFIATVGDGNDNMQGNAGIDTYDLSGTSADATITAVSATSAEIGLDALNSVENIVGSQGNDTITLNGGNNVIDGQGGNDTMTGGVGTDTFVFGPSFGNDVINDFDANPNPGQDFLDISAFGLSSADIGGPIAITVGQFVNGGALDTQITIDGNTIILSGVTGVGANSITDQDFIF